MRYGVPFASQAFQRQREMHVKAQRGLGAQKPAPLRDGALTPEMPGTHGRPISPGRFFYCSLDLAPVTDMPRFCANATSATSCT
jgi:hypothetical protein